MFIWTSLSLVFVKSWKEICLFHLFCCFSCSWMSLQCVYLDNDCLILFLIVGSAKDLVFYDKIFRKIKVYKKYLSPHFTVIVSNVHSNYYNDLIKLLQSVLVILLCRYKRYNICLNSFLVCMNYFWLLFVLIILKDWLMVCLELRFLILFLLLLLLHQLLLVALVV